MQMAILPNYDVVVAERKGALRYYDNTARTLKTIAQLNVFSGIEDGLLGVAADPDFSNNHWLYLYYGVGGNKNVSHLARFELNGQKLVRSSEKVLLEVPTQRQYCCHSAGYITFDPQGLLYLSVGDNTNAEEIEGHNPTDERPGRELADDQGTSANSNDLRGKILRIRPESDGTYTIPDGNLFPRDGSQGRPEVYAMGMRNPFRVSVDAKNGYVYWGDVGPDTEIKAEEGKLSYEEINQARKPGFFGYPYFLGANEVFPDYDFATKKEGPGKDPARPVNDSPNNTGIRELPPAQPAWIWYGKGPSRRWPEVGKGGASAMTGPVYYRDLYPNAPYKLPEYYHGKLFIYDWIRKWIMAITMDKEGNYVRMEPFLPELRVVAPIDMQIAPDGAIYLLAYGTNWFARNTNSGIIRVEYAEGNRRPIAVMSARPNVGGVPLTVQLSAKGSRDFDEHDKLTYTWNIGGRAYQGEQLKHTFTKPGVYDVVLSVADQHGSKGTATTQIKVGNTPPEVRITSQSNRSFYWDDAAFDYKISINDKEDQTLNPERITASFNYLSYGKDLATALASTGGTGMEYVRAQQLYASLDCKSCHTVETKSIGPALKMIAERYRDSTGMSARLADKIIRGGSGSWGSYPMPPHADLPRKDAEDIAEYILSLARTPEQLPLTGSVRLTGHEGKGSEGAYMIQAGYTDSGHAGIEPIHTSSHLVLRNPLIQMEDYDEGNAGVVIATKNTGFISYIANITFGKFVRFNHIDLTGVAAIHFRVQEQGAGGRIEIRRGTKTGTLIGSVEIAGGQAADPVRDWKDLRVPLSGARGMSDLFFVFKNEKKTGPLFHVDYMYFEKQK
ncbi:PQQ-dependent sugar dehydrogenase [Dyadobacter sandarakinus]|uniref:PQQ-dependent sugar dehydrogenase n=2 Tax=Dyadobacter sandarakinus TaxID=2747268 RepID=A0ABX7IED2_9BACT|nr:PQQ-dependent sugar dehydrogenase [Dyadobacter sandarakinus]